MSVATLFTKLPANCSDAICGGAHEVSIAMSPAEAWPHSSHARILGMNSKSVFMPELKSWTQILDSNLDFEFKSEFRGQNSGLKFGGRNLNLSSLSPLSKEGMTISVPCCKNVAPWESPNWQQCAHVWSI